MAVVPRDHCTLVGLEVMMDSVTSLRGDDELWFKRPRSALFYRVVALTQFSNLGGDLIISYL